jgi:hypothetical protein
MPTLTDPQLRAEKAGPSRREIPDDLRSGLYFVIEALPKSGIKPGVF